MTIEAKIIADSISPDGVRLTTMQLVYPRFIHSEFMTHRMFSRNASSSRAIPVTKMIAAVYNAPAAPIHWGLNQPGMQAKEELGEHDKSEAKNVWLEAKNAAVWYSNILNDQLGAHKQIVNRLLEPFQHIHVVVTATEWDNFFKLRLHPDAQPEIQELARVMADAMRLSKPRLLKVGDWHLPYTNPEEFNALSKHPKMGAWNGIEDAIKCSVARCARVSYLKHDGSSPSIEEDIALYDKLAEHGHLSPFEHAATPLSANRQGTIGNDWPEGATHLDIDANYWSGNFRGWRQYRQLMENK